MPCTSPNRVGFLADGKTLSWSPKNYSKEYASFQLPCGQCLECRLDYARQWALRCVHEAAMHEKNSFITLTYSDESLVSEKLIYKHFQDFMKRLRKVQNDPIGVFVTGEYGEKTKRPHWHAIIFNWNPSDKLPHYSTERGDQVYTSAQLTKLWGHGHAELGSVTIESAGYCARYAAKKLAHGKDQDHDFHPISKKSSKHAIGKKWLEKHWPDVFLHGHIVLPTGETAPIPRYYEKWLKTHRPSDWLAYVTRVKIARIEAQQKVTDQESRHWWDVYNKRPLDKPTPLTRNQVRNLIKIKAFDELQAYLKL